jgi:hypothetical protein
MSSVLIMVQIILTQFLTIIIVDLTVPMFNLAGKFKMLIRRTLECPRSLYNPPRFKSQKQNT